MLEFDHAIVAVADLDEAAKRFSDEYGLESVYGGEHLELGTANRIIPVGDFYIELLAVVDQERFARTRLPWPDRERLIGWMARTAHIEEAAARLGLTVRQMSRQAQSGLLAWRLAGLECIATEPSLPVLIDWSAEQSEHPTRAKVSHRCRPIGLRWIELSGSADRIKRWCGDSGLPLRLLPGEPAVRGLVLRTDGADLAIRYDG